MESSGTAEPTSRRASRERELKSESSGTTAEPTTRRVRFGDKVYSCEHHHVQHWGRMRRKPFHVHRKENQTMLLRLYSLFVILIDISALILKCFFTVGQEMYTFFFPPKEKSVADDVVLITGTGHGIGRELAIQFAELGATVICLDINADANGETVEMIKNKGCTKVYGYECDVTDRAEVISVMDEVRKDCGEDVTIVVNNAGIMPCRRFKDYSPEEINKMFSVNVYAHFWILQETLPYMVKNNNGHIVALSSMAGILGLRNLVPYCATKFAVRGMMEALAEEIREEGVAPDIQFTCVFPYMVDTGLCKKPRVRFPGMLAMVSPKMAAELIIKAVRRNQLAITIPSCYMYINDIVRLFPFKVGRLIKDFLDVELEADDEPDFSPTVQS